MGHVLNERGNRHGRLTVIEQSGVKNTEMYWKCRCDCGTQTTVRGTHLRSGGVTSCGCWRQESMRSVAFRHGLAETAAYRVWSTILARCTSLSSKSYPDYGGRGIKLCERWHSLELFVADMGQPPKGMEIDRINNDGNYEPGNCRWTSRLVNANNKRNNVFIELRGQRLSVADAARLYRIPYQCLSKRIHRGESPEHAVRPSSRKGSP